MSTLADHHDYVVKRLTEDGASKHQVARELGVLETTLVSYTWRHDIKMRGQIRWDDDWLRQYYGTMTIAEMARQYGVNAGTMRHRLVKLGLHEIDRVTSKTDKLNKVLSCQWES